MKWLACIFSALMLWSCTGGPGSETTNGICGFAYIGAIEELLDRGYEISSVAGVSAGSLVGGIYAAGGLEAFNEKEGALFYFGDAIREFDRRETLTGSKSTIANLRN